MDRKIFIRNSAFTAAGLLLAQKNLLASFFQTPAFKIKMLNKETGIFTEKGGTILFSFTKDGIVVIDTEFPEQSQHLIDELKKQSDQPFRLVINTHHHGDHSSGNISFKGIVPHVLAHENSKTNQQVSAQKNKTEDKQLYPDQTYGSTWCEDIGKENFCLHYFGAGHTNGDSLVQLQKANIVHMGDLLFNRRHPFVDRSAGASMKNWITVLDKTLDKFNKRTTYIFGHAADGYDVTGTSEDLKAFRNYLEKTLTFVEGEIKAGKTKDEIIKATAIPGAEEWKGDGIDRPLTAAYEELTA
ncbi:MBL fold metallo-hydrolase [Panacibacter ginsenosidivorans]|uniref:MBL fold metallo-hydrolase n=1 Tax=Panacibacter ginsenosidivorans TaxID=1813871 RepID=A0A5B8V969_9BACT|nr:MBL fold metallo-hydrolase [Panacibacter ginsenosidivorans]QEC67779.1 MBL fold metallo-hydrolase [Panacibacter ginsenosidivorans]